MSLRREMRRMVGGMLNVAAARVMNRRRPVASVVPLALERYRARSRPTPIETAWLLAGRPNHDRARVLEAVLRAGPTSMTRSPYRTIEGAGVNLFADVGAGAATVLLAAHHDAVPGSPGANDNGAAVGVLLELWRRLAADPPRRLTVRLAFFGGEERAMLGSRAYARQTTLGHLVGVVSLELCGIGDTLALWDVTPALERTALVRTWVAAVESLGYRKEEGYRLAEPVPFFGSDHRPFADRGVAGVGLTVVPAAAAEALRAFIYGGVRGILVPPSKRPAPFTTYHTSDDHPDTLELAATARVIEALERFCRMLDDGGVSAS